MEYNRILILSPHTDDAEFGCGGTIVKFLENNKEIHWVVFSIAEDSLPNELNKLKLQNEFINVTKELNLKESDYTIFRYPVRKLSDYRQEILESLIKFKQEFKPDLVIGPSQNDYHQDHQVISNEMIRAFKTHSSILCYELPWNHINFTSSYFIKLEERHIQMKLKILSKYETQIVLNRFYFSEDMVRGLALTRGAQINYKYAESFDVLRIID
ncbi:PIG-L deacetylase family protein [Rosettibacter firmus]|uniref:PIG-L deacetylase family protein n=1 Tax=Rosettibacter firmus TaxID=3111522 RepID=UPI00336BC9A5